MNKIVVIDYGMGNLKSIQRGLEKVGGKVILSSNYSDVVAADRVVLPGVGAFESGMTGLKDFELMTAIDDFVKSGNPLLGICLGMQMLLGKSEEHGLHQGLGLIPGSVVKIPECDKGKFSRKIPHIGWTRIQTNNEQSWHDSCLENIKVGDYFYFVHSFMAIPDNNKNILAICEDENTSVVAAIKKDNITGLQFHPEKSGKSGLDILRKFVNT
jgi:glutamine amidotransferase